MQHLVDYTCYITPVGLDDSRQMIHILGFLRLARNVHIGAQVQGSPPVFEFGTDRAHQLHVCTGILEQSLAAFEAMLLGVQLEAASAARRTT